MLLVAGLFLVHCSGPETIIVRENPTPASPDTLSEDTTASVPSAAFRQVNIGEIDPIPTLDPLFAENASTMRALQLLYEGLVRYDAAGDIMPAAAESWKVSADSLTYTFTLRNNIFYHDSDIFSSGVGRKLVASDVKRAFERMARSAVPPHAARLFMDIKGFQPYYKEHRLIYQPQQRQLAGISGISVSGDSTITFSLVQKDSSFLQKLASPYALIYPHEAVRPGENVRFRAVGSGPFQLSRQRGDSLYIFSKFNNYHTSGQPVVNRVDVSVIQQENNLFKSFAAGELHLIPQLGLQVARQVLNTNGELRQSYESSYRLAKGTGQTEYSLNWNPEADPDQHAARFVTGLIDSTFMADGLPRDFIALSVNPVTDSSYAFSASDTLVAAYTESNYARHFINRLGVKLRDRGAHLTFSPVRVPTRNTGLYTRQHLVTHPGETWDWSRERAIVRFSVPHVALYIRELRNFSFNRYPWWINLRQVTLPVIETL